jgi:hypothetical protein
MSSFEVLHPHCLGPILFASCELQTQTLENLLVHGLCCSSNTKTQLAKWPGVHFPYRTLGKVFAGCSKKVLSKEPFADKMFVEYSLPSVTLSKGFAKCKITFTECMRYLAKKTSPIVIKIDLCSSLANVKSIFHLTEVDSYCTHFASCIPFVYTDLCFIWIFISDCKCRLNLIF